MSKIAVAMADGVEEIEGLTVVDLCRRAGIEVEMVSVSGNLTVHGSHGIDFAADVLFEDADWDSYDMLVLPGGKVGTENLEAHAGLVEVLDRFAEDKTPRDPERPQSDMPSGLRERSAWGGVACRAGRKGRERDHFPRSRDSDRVCIGDHRVFLRSSQSTRNRRRDRI